MISLLNSRTDNEPRPLPPGTDWLDLFSRRDLRDRKDGPAFVGATFKPGGRRCAADVEAITVATYDVDEGPIDPSAVAARLEAAGIEHLIHSSHSHRATKPALRVLLPLARPVPPSAWPAAWKRGAALIGPGVSKKSADPCHLFYLPSCPADHEGEAIRIYRPGPRIDLLEGAADPVVSTPAVPAPPAPSSPVEPPPVELPAGRKYDPLEILALVQDQPRAAEVYEGRALPDGERDAPIHALIGSIVFRSSAQADEASVVGFFAPTIEAIRSVDPATKQSLARVAEQYRRARRDWQREQQRNAASQAGFRRMVGEHARRREAPDLSGPRDPQILAAIQRQAVPLDDEIEIPDVGPAELEDLDEASTAPYSAEELKALAVVADAPVDRMDRRWIIQTGASYYVLTEHGYASPIQREALAASLPRDLARAPVQLRHFTKDGEPRPATVESIIAAHATVARRLISSLVDPVSRYDAATQTFYEAVAPIRPDLSPVYDAQVDAWLRLLGGARSELLLDWVATVADLTRPTAALYIVGPKGAGKTLLAAGLARIWSVGAPTSAKQILVDSWNSALADCPLILADEGLPETRGRAMSQEVRELLGSSSRPFQRKFKDDASLVGCVRLIVTANHDRAIASMMRGEERSAEDIEAVSERFLVIRCPTAAAQYLEQIGGRPATVDWVAGDKIARHALWLRKHRTVDPRGRWLVAGVAGDLSDSLSVSGSISSLVVEWVSRAIMEPSKIAGVLVDPPGISCVDGRIFVRPGFIHENFESYVIGQKTPTTHAIGQACSSLAPAGGSQVYHLRTRYRELRAEAIRGWAMENLLVSREDFDAAIGVS